LDRHEKKTAGILSPPLPLPSSSSNSTSTHSDIVPLDIIQKPAQVYLSPYRAPTSPASPFTASAETLNECCAPLSAQAPRTHSTMGFTKSQRIGILLGIDSVFFLVELIVGEWCPSSSRRVSRQ
jgi:hypothetical protein